MQWPPRPGPGLEAHEAERLRRGGVDDLPDVDPHPVAELRELVDERDVDRAEDVLEQLRQLGRLGRRDAVDAVDRRCRTAPPRPRSRPRRCRRRPSAPSSSCGRCGPGRRAPGEKARWKSTPARQPRAALEDRQHLVAGRARVRRRLEHDEVARAQPRRDLLGRRAHDREVGLALLRERRRQRDQDRVGLAQLVVVGRRAQAALLDELLQLLARDVLDVALAAVQLRDALGADVDEQHRAPGVGEDLGERHADIAGADDCDVTMHSGAIVPPSTAAIRSEACPSP